MFVSINTALRGGMAGAFTNIFKGIPIPQYTCVGDPCSHWDRDLAEEWAIEL